jgi:hypothetical protein
LLCRCDTALAQHEAANVAFSEIGCVGHGA